MYFYSLDFNDIIKCLFNNLNKSRKISEEDRFLGGSGYMLLFRKNEINTGKLAGVLLIVVLGIPVVSWQNFLLAHVLAEGWSIIIAILIYVLSTQTYRFSRRDYLLFIGKAFLAVAIIDFFHTLAYKGMGVLPDLGTDPPTQLWVAARYVQAISFLLAPFVAKLKLSSSLLLYIYLTITGAILLSVFGLDIFPTCFVEGEGLTPFKIISEYVICLILLMAIIYLFIHKDAVSDLMRKILILSMSLTIFSEFLFTLYYDVYGVTNMAGHVLKVAAFYLIYEGVVARGLNKPYEEIFQELKKSSILDNLTGLYNRTGYMELSRKLWEYASRDGGSLSLMMIDLDNFKQVNDSMGHREGDRVLRKAGEIIARNTRATDIVSRIGGDEFLVVAKGAPSNLRLVQGRIQADFSHYIEMEELPSFIGISFGISTLKPSGGFIRDIEVLFHDADQAMYLNKILKRSRPFASITEREQDISRFSEEEE